MPNTAPEKATVHVAVAVIQRRGEDGEQILLAKRPEHVHQGGLWEFPGGKVEPGEPVLTALNRELHEELDLTLPASGEQPQPLIRIRHDYGDKEVLLDVWRVPETSGTPHGKEGQVIRWVALSELAQYDFPAANHAIVNACQLPCRYAFTASVTDYQELLRQVQRLRQQDLTLIRLRQPDLNDDHYYQWVIALAEQFPDSRGWLVADRPVPEALRPALRAVHLGQRRSRILTNENRASLCGELLLGVSCHNEQELARAHELNAGFATLSPVLDTNSHPGAVVLGWQGFQTLAMSSRVPVYALGGMQSEHECLAVQHGGQGIAAISAWQNIRNREK